MAATSRRPVLSTFQRLAVVLLVGGLTIGGLALAGKPSGGGGKTKPAISVSPTSLAFGDQAVNTTSVAKTVTITSSGTASLIINSVTLSGSSYFAISGGCTAGSTLAPGATCTINVTFTPAAASVTGNIAIVSNASNTPTVSVALSGTGKSTTTVAVRLGKGGGDSIMRGYNADCTSNTGLFSFLCYGGGDKPQYSFFDGSSTTVLSIEDRYIQVDPLFSADQNAAASGSEMTDPAKNNFLAQATAIVTGTTQPARVFIELGGNDICNRGTVSQLYSDSTWETAVRAGLDKLVAGLPDGSTVLMVSVPRVQDLRAAGIQKQQTASSVNCENFWASYDVCRIATAGGTDLATRLEAIDARQKAYNAKLATLAAGYSSQATSTGVEVVTDYDSSGSATSVGTYSFQPGDINGGDCFHPSIQGQNRLSEVIWNRNPHK
jgi:lysophospholipase L1-like esterase